jgi:hypothetical protein
MHMENAFAKVKHLLDRAADRLTVDPRTRQRVVNVAIVGQRAIAGEKHEWRGSLAVNQLCEKKTHALAGKRVRSRKVGANLVV